MGAGRWILPAHRENGVPRRGRETAVGVLGEPACQNVPELREARATTDYHRRRSSQASRWKRVLDCRWCLMLDAAGPVRIPLGTPASSRSVVATRSGDLNGERPDTAQPAPVQGVNSRLAPRGDAIGAKAQRHARRVLTRRLVPRRARRHRSPDQVPPAWGRLACGPPRRTCTPRHSVGCSVRDR